MDSLNIDRKVEPNDRYSWFWTLLRLLGGSVGGGISGLLLLVITFSLGPVALLGFIFLGQYLLFERIVNFVSSTLYADAISYELNFLISVLAYALAWGLIGALFAFGKKKQVLIGSITTIIYVVVGLLAFKVYGSTMLPT